MSCKRCPHHVRHGQLDAKTKQITFKDRCALKMKEAQDCVHYPFPKIFDYLTCEVYRLTFKATVDRNDVQINPDRGISDSITMSSITDMELM